MAIDYLIQNIAPKSLSIMLGYTSIVRDYYEHFYTSIMDMH